MEENLVPPSRRDVLSGLHDNVLGHILSFLPTQDAFSTSFLSRRWRHLWKSTPSLDLDYEDFLRHGRHNGPRLFCHFVSHVMSIRDPVAGVQRFRLRWQARQMEANVKLAARWINLALRDGPGGGGLLQELDLHLFTFSRFPLEGILRHAPSLEQLSLATDKDYPVVFARPPCLPSIRTLRLRKFMSDEAAPERLLPSAVSSRGSLELFIAGCPSLEDLTLEDCSFRRLRISAPRLVRLAVTPDYRRGEGVHVEAPVLRSVHYSADWKQKPWRLRGPMRLLHASVDLIFLESMDLGRLADALGEGTHTLKSLVLRFTGATVPPEEEVHPVFESLKALKLFIHINKQTIQAITFLLSHSPALETLQVEYPKHGSRLSEELVKVLEDNPNFRQRVILRQTQF